MSSTGDGMPAWWESLKVEFECPVCLDTMTEAPIFICDNPLGHSICSNCAETLRKDRKKCPVCNANLASRRNLGMEKMVEKLPKVQCKFEGCGFKKSDGEAVKKHEENDCEYRHIPCAKCDDKVPLKNIADHVINHTGAVTFKGLPVNKIRKKPLGKPGYQVTSYQCVYQIEANDGLTFLTNWQPSEDGNSVYYWIAFVGPKESAKNFIYTLKVGEANKAGWYPFEGTRFCVPCDLSHADMKESKCCLMLDKDLIEDATHFEENQKKITYTVSIHKA